MSKDTEGVLWISKGSENDETEKYEIVDDYGTAVDFDWSFTWAGKTREATAFAVEGVDSDGNDTPDYWRLAIKHTTTDQAEKATAEAAGQTYTAIEDWETLKINVGTNDYITEASGIVDFSSYTFSDAKLWEAELNQDLDGDGATWSATNETLTEVDTDTKGTKAHLDSSNNLYVQDAGSDTKTQVLDESGDLISFNETATLGSYGSISKEVIAVETAIVSDSEVYKVLVKSTGTFGSGDSASTDINYETVNVDKSTMQVDWGTLTYTDDPIKLEDTFTLDLNGDNEVSEISANAAIEVSTDKTGAKLAATTDGSLFIKDGDTSLQVTGPDGGFIDLNFSESWTGGSFTSEAIASQKVGDNYKIAVEETVTFGESTDISYQVYTLDANAKIDWNNVAFRTSAELNEDEFGQDLNADGSISQGSSSSASDTYTNLVNTANIDASVEAAYGNTAQSPIIGIANSQSDSTDSEIEMFSGGVEGRSKSTYQLDVDIIQEANDAVLAKVGNDTGLDSSNIKPLTGLMDFNVTIDDPDNYGQIVSLSWVIPEGTTDPKYLKKDQASGEYFDFAYDETTGEGAIFDSETNLMTVYVKDNGRYDSDSSLGVVRDPALLAGSGTDSSASDGNVLTTTTTTDTSTDTSTSSSSSLVSVAEVNSSYIADSNGFASVTGSSPVTITAYTVGEKATLDAIKDFDGSLHAGDTLDDTPTSYKYHGMLDVNGDGTFEAIFTNDASRRWVTAKIDSTTGQINFDDNGEGGGTRVVGIYADPLIAEGEDNGGYLSDGVTPAPANFGVSDADRYVEYNGETVDRLALNSQVRFQNDLDIDNLEAKHSGDYDGDGVHEVYWKTSDGTAYLRSLMHDDGNIRYANYQSEDQMGEYLTNQGFGDITVDITGAS